MYCYVDYRLELEGNVIYYMNAMLKREEGKRKERMEFSGKFLNWCVLLLSKVSLQRMYTKVMLVFDVDEHCK